MNPEQPDTVDAHLPGLVETIRWIRHHWRPDRRYLPGLVLLSFLNAGIVVAYPLFLKLVIDRVTSLDSPRELVWPASGMLLVGFVQFLIYTTMQRLRARLNLRFQFGTRMRAFEVLLRDGRDPFDPLRIGDLVTRLTDDINEKLSWFLCSGIFRLLEALMLIAWGIAVMVWLNPRLALLTAGPLPLLIVIFLHFDRLIYL